MQTSFSLYMGKVRRIMYLPLTTLLEKLSLTTKLISHQQYQNHSHGHGNNRSPPVCNYCHKTGNTSYYYRKSNYQSQSRPVLSSQSHQQEDNPEKKKFQSKKEEKEETTNPFMSHQINKNRLMELLPWMSFRLMSSEIRGQFC